MKPLFPVNTNRRNKTNKRPTDREEPTTKVSSVNEFLWALIGLLLTILGTFVEVSVTSPPWSWAEQGIQLRSLGVTYQVGAVLLTGCLGGKNAGALAQIAYLILGLIWLPTIFAQGGGLGYLQQPSFGYILGFIPGAWLCGWLAFQARPKLESLAFSAFCGLLTIHVLGLVYLLGLSYWNPGGETILSPTNLPQTMMAYSLAPLPAHLVIVCVVAVIAFLFRKILFY